MLRETQPKTTMLALLFFCLVLALFSPFTTPAESSEMITYRLKWLFNASVVGDIAAHEQGAFKAEGLKVDIKEGGPERDAIRELELGYAHFGVASADQVIRALSKGSPVVVVAQLFQINPLQWIYRRENLQINQVQDIQGKVVGITFGGNDETIMRTLMAKNGITEKDITIFSVRYDYTPFYQKKVDIWPVYRNSQAPILERKLAKDGESVAYFNPADHGVKFVANSVVTSKRMVETQPDTVAKFTRALLKGWEQALNPQNETVVLKMLQGYDKDTAPDIMQEQLKLTRSLVKPQQNIRIGSIDVEAWRQTEKIMLDQKQIPKPVHVEAVIRHPF